ncbi:hypothetical protein Tco_0142174 [Tanacetum coccineum]
MMLIRMKALLLDQTEGEETLFEAGDTQGLQKQRQDIDWNVRKSVDFKPPQTWISKIAQAEKPPISFDELMTFNLLKRTFKSYVELKYNIEECYKAVTDQLEWNNPEGKEYLFDLSKPLPLIMERGRQVVPVDYFINNDLEYPRGGS